MSIEVPVKENGIVTPKALTPDWFNYEVTNKVNSLNDLNVQIIEIQGQIKYLQQLQEKYKDNADK